MASAPRAPGRCAPAVLRQQSSRTARPVVLEAASETPLDRPDSLVGMRHDRPRARAVEFAPEASE
jgi:hypothetical protein